ncbi:MAG: alpha/beta fold hydrolase [Aestuariibacter sp.]
MLLNYTIAGQGEPLILMHGLFGSLENLGVIAKQLQQQFQVISIDLPDHGRSPHSNQFSYQQYAQSIVDTLDSLQIGECHLLGHSMGGKVAMTIALSNAKRVKKLLVADIAPVKYEPRHDNVFKALTAVDLDNISSRTEADKQMAQYVEEIGVRQFLLKSLEKTDTGFRWRFNLNMLQRDYESLSAGMDSSNSFDKPTLFVKGGNSNYISEAHQQAILQLFPRANAKIINDTGHWLHAEKPFVFAGIAERFFKDEH